MGKSKKLGASASLREDNSPPNALTVRACEIIFPQGVETLGEKANFLHAYSVEASKRSTGAAILAGWVLSVARSTCAYGQWMQWLEQNVSFGARTATNYLSLYAQTLGAQRAAMRRPIALDVPPTEDELEAAAHDVDGKSLSALYKSTRLMKASDKWGGPGRNQGRKTKGAKGGVEAAEEMVELDKVAETHSGAWSTVSDHLRSLQDAQREHHVFDRLEVVELAEANSILNALCKDVKAALQRFDNI